MNTRILQLITLITALVAFGAAADEGRKWPTGEWDTATPESQQVDVAVLDELDRQFASGDHGNIDGMTVYRNGYLVYEKSYDIDYDELFSGVDETPGMYSYHDPAWHPWFDRGELHTIQSISKSVTSALIGIAIDRGEIPGVEVKAMPYFDGYETADNDARWNAITLRDLLTMTSGIDWDEDTTAYTDPRNSAAAMEASDEWVQYVLGLPMRATPGEKFEYNSGVTVLLSHILLQATGKHADVYAEEHLFGPLGIKEYYWKKTPTGLVDTEGGLYLKSDDLAKIGYLYMNGGNWDGRQIFPEEWVANSMSPSTGTPGSDYRYGYQWWLLPYEGGSEQWAYTGLGYGGQRLLVVPEYGLVAMFTGWNIDEIPSLDAQMALDRVLNSVR